MALFKYSEISSTIEMSTETQLTLFKIKGKVVEVITKYISGGHFNLAKPMVPGKLPKSVLDFRCFEPPALRLAVFLFLSDTRCSFVQP